MLKNTKPVSFRNKNQSHWRYYSCDYDDSEHYTDTNTAWWRSGESPSRCAKSSQSEKSRQPNHNRVRICKPNMKVWSYRRLVIFPFLPRFPDCTLPHFPPLSLQGGSALPLPRVPRRFPAARSAGAAVPAGKRLPAALPRVFGGEPALQVSAQNKHSWLSYEPPEG